MRLVLDGVERGEPGSKIRRRRGAGRVTADVHSAAEAASCRQSRVCVEPLGWTLRSWTGRSGWRLGGRSTDAYGVQGAKHAKRLQQPDRHHQNDNDIQDAFDFAIHGNVGVDEPK